MKTFIKTILQLSLFVTLLFGMGTFADASGFVSDPWLTGNRITTAATVNDSAEGENSITLSGDYFYLFTTYQNKTDDNLTHVKGRFNFPTSGTSSSVTITGKLTADTGGVETDDYVTINGMPDEWELELIDASVKNVNGAVHDFCTPTDSYNYDLSVSAAAVSNSWANFPWYAATLDTYAISGLNGYSGLCDQGQLHATFRVIDVTDEIIIIEEDDPVIDTNNATSIGVNSAQMNGTVIDGTVTSAYFAYSTDDDISCLWPAITVPGTYDTGESFDADIVGLLAGTEYFYYACANYDGGYISGGLESFFTLTDGGGDGGGDDEPDATTESATSIEDTEAILHGNIDMNDFDDGLVFFVWGENYVSIINAASADSYSDVMTDGDNLQKHIVDTDLDGTNDYDYGVDDLDADTDIYFRICVEYIDDEDELECGSVLDFNTDDDGGDDEENPDATTHSAEEVDENSAELNGYVDMNDFDNGDVFFVWGESESAVEDVEDEDSYGDVDTDGDNLRKEMVDDDLDDSESYSLDVDSLDVGDDYYFRICVDYYDDGDEVECGSVKHFDTDSDDGGDHDYDSEIETMSPDTVGSTSAKMCGDLLSDGGDDGLRTWIEYRRTTSGTFKKTSKKNRGEIYYCVTVTSLSPGTSYKYRACSDDDCGAEYKFTTAPSLSSKATERPVVSTDAPSNIRSNSAVLNGFYVSNSDNVRVWYNYGRTDSLGKQTRTYNKYGAYGAYIHNFTGLASNTTYYYQAVAQNDKGTAYGNILSFRTGNSGFKVEKKIEVGEIDLAKLGLGLSLIRLEIDDDREQVVNGENIEYEVTWENISTLDLTDIDLKVTLPVEVQITNSSRGIFDADQNSIFYSIDDLDNGEDGRLTIFATVTNGSLGDALTAEATLAFDNPVNQAQENATDYDVDELVVRNGFGTASVFGLSNISFLGWLVILLGLLIIFLVARWLYIEREELRAQAYVGGYGRPAPAPAYNYAPPVAPQVPAQPVYQAPTPPTPAYQAPVVNSVETPADPGYKPYKPNR